MTRLWPLVVVLAFLTHAPAVAVSEYQDEVVRVLDGDTIEVLHNNITESIRLSGIDCPERGQAYGTHANQAASEMVFSKDVTDSDSRSRQVWAAMMTHSVLSQSWYREYTTRPVWF